MSKITVFNQSLENFVSVGNVIQIEFLKIDKFSLLLSVTNFNINTSHYYSSNTMSFKSPGKLTEIALNRRTAHRNYQNRMCCSLVY